MRNLPDTSAERISLHARGSDELLKISVPGDPQQYRQLWSVFYSYSEKPFPTGGFEIRAPLPPPYDVVRFDIVDAGFNHVILGTDGPIFPKGLDLEFVLTGNASRKEMAVVLR